MTEVEKEKLRQVISRTDKSGNEKVDMLIELMEAYAAQQKSETPTAEDVKRWFQLLVGKSEDAMIEDIKKWCGQKSEIKMPTEEEIEEAAYSYACCAPIVGQSRMGFRAGIEWLRNQITER